MSELTTLPPQVVPADAGEARWWGSGLAIVKGRAAGDGGATIVEMTEPPGYRSPLHVHHREDEGFWILAGSAVFEIGDTTIEAHTGDYLLGPRDVPHRYTAGPDGCRMLFVVTPGAGFEAMLMAVTRPAASRTLPPPSEPPTAEQLARTEAAIRAHGCEILG